MEDITQLQTDMQMLSVRIMDDQNRHCGSGLLYIHDDKNVFVLTAAHVLGEIGEGESFLVKCHPDPMTANEATEEEDKHIFSIRRTEATVQPAYVSGAFPKHKFNVNDAAVIRLDISRKEEWLLKRKRAKFAPEKQKLEGKKIAGSGYPMIKGENPSTHMASEEIDPTKAICKKHNLEAAQDDSKHEVEWSLGIEVSDPYGEGETGGWSGCILALAETNEIALAGVALAIYPNYQYKVFRGADMHFFRKLLEGKWLNKVNEAVLTPDMGNSTEASRADTRESVVNAPAMPPASDFNLRCVRNMLEGAPAGQSWAHKLRENRGMNVSFKKEVGQPMCLDGFEDDAKFLKAIFPEKILRILGILFVEKEDEKTVANIMDCTYGNSKKKEIRECLTKSIPMPVEEIIVRCKALMEARNWERNFVASYTAFFDLMGDKVRYFRFHMQECKTHDNMAIGMAMFVVYALLGDDHYYALTGKKQITEIFRVTTG